MKPTVKKNLVILTSFTVYFIVRYNVSFNLTTLMHQGEFTNIFLFPWSYYFYHIFFNCLLGGLMGFGYLLDERNKKGKWRLDINKSIIFLLPLFILSLGEIIYFEYTNISFIRRIIENFNISITLFQILFGFNIVRAFYKEA